MGTNERGFNNDQNNGGKVGHTVSEPEEKCVIIIQFVLPLVQLTTVCVPCFKLGTAKLFFWFSFEEFNSVFAR